VGFDTIHERSFLMHKPAGFTHIAASCQVPAALGQERGLPGVLLLKGLSQSQVVCGGLEKRGGSVVCGTATARKKTEGFRTEVQTRLHGRFRVPLQPTHAFQNT